MKRIEQPLEITAVAEHRHEECVHYTACLEEASDRKDFTNRTALIVRYCFDPETTSSVVYGEYGGTE